MQCWEHRCVSLASTPHATVFLVSFATLLTQCEGAVDWISQWQLNTCAPSHTNESLIYVHVCAVVGCNQKYMKHR